MPGRADTPTGGGESASGTRGAHHVSFREALRVWVRVAAYSFGGPAGQIAVMQRILVDEKRWFSQNRFLHAMNYTMLLPGPEAQQLATYGGWMLHGWRGGLVAGGLFVLPGFLSILVLSVLYAGFQDVAFVAAVFFGLKPAVLAIVLEAMIRIGRRALTTTVARAIAAGAFIAIFVFGILFPLIIATAAVIGYLGRRIRGDRFLVSAAPAGPDAGAAASVFGDQATAGRRPRIGSTLATAALWLAIWWVPILVMVAVLGADDIFVIEGLFFSQVAVVTFGGAYAVLAYIAQQAVDVYGWLGPGEMLDGLGMAETTPGPLIQVVQFVGFMGAYRNAGTIDPMLAGLIGSVVTTWVTFMPCFLWIFVGAPYIEYLRGRRALAAALAAVTAAVVGVILNLALWFAIHTLFRETRMIGRPFDMTVPVLSTVEPAAVGIGLVAFFVLFGLRWGMFRTLGISVLLGIAYRTAIGG
ncbi:MAG TPA: chromate efflux transporter [Longimicrobiales bacterium]|nr:chromate efflux transporter [Longimicrobiales bacterium]